VAIGFTVKSMKTKAFKNWHSICVMTG